MTYEQAIQVARDLIDPEGFDWSEGSNREYVRGQVELLADMYAVPGVFMDERKGIVARDLGIPKWVIL